MISNLFGYFVKKFRLFFNEETFIDLKPNRKQIGNNRVEKVAKQYLAMLDRLENCVKLGQCRTRQEGDCATMAIHLISLLKRIIKVKKRTR